MFSPSVTYLRNYQIDSIHKMQDDWRVETRIRLNGKNQGGLYRVYRHPTSGQCFWSLRAAKQSGFAGYMDDTPEDLRKCRKPKAKASKKQAKK